jgi:hypothetical protein
MQMIMHLETKFLDPWPGSGQFGHDFVVQQVSVGGPDAHCDEVGETKEGFNARPEIVYSEAVIPLKKKRTVNFKVLRVSCEQCAESAE